MTKYFFFAFGNFKNNAYQQFVVDAFLDVTNTSMLKFRVFEGSIVVHFGSRMDVKKLKTHIDSVMQNITKIYFLLEYTDKKVLSMLGSELDSFMILDNEGGKKKNDIINDMNGIEFDIPKTNKKETNFWEDIFQKIDNNKKESDNDGYNNVLKECQKTKKDEITFNLDDILDKISSKGINSLTKEEHNYLNNLSK